MLLSGCSIPPDTTVIAFVSLWELVKVEIDLRLLSHCVLDGFVGPDGPRRLFEDLLAEDAAMLLVAGATKFEAF